MKHTCDFKIVVLLLACSMFWNCDSDSTTAPDNDSSSSVILSVSSSSSSSRSSSSGAVNPVSSAGGFSNEITDSRDLQVYKTVTIGDQTWMAENLNYALNGSWCYNNSQDSCAKYGRLYLWTSVMDIDSIYTDLLWGGSDLNHQGVCPNGSHVPSITEWKTLKAYVKENNGGDDVGKSLKTSTGWIRVDGVETGSDGFGFSALPAGIFMYSDYSNAVGSYTCFFAATENGTSLATNVFLSFEHNLLFISEMSKNVGCSVRCVVDSVRPDN